MLAYTKKEAIADLDFIQNHATYQYNKDHKIDDIHNDVARTYSLVVKYCKWHKNPTVTIENINLNPRNLKELVHFNSVMTDRLQKDHSSISKFEYDKCVGSIALCIVIIGIGSIIIF